MKKIIGLSAALCLLISVMAGLGAFAAETTYYNINFDSWDIDVAANDESLNNPAEALDAAFASAAGANGSAWYVDTEKFTGDAKVSTVVATEENASWTDRGKVLKIEGTPIGSAVNATLSIKIPFAGYDVNSYTDRFYIEFDVFVPSVPEANRSSVSFDYMIFGTEFWNSFRHVANKDVMKARGLVYSKNAEGKNGTTSIDDHTKWYYATAGYGSEHTLGTWRRIKMIIDNRDKNPIMLKDVETLTQVAYSNIRTLTLISKDLSTGDETTDVVAYALSKYNSDLYIGGAKSQGDYGLSGTFYLDNVKLYTQNKFAFESSADKDAENVSIEKDSVSFTMNGAVKADSLLGITLTGDGNTVDITPDIDADGKTVVVTINEELDYGTTYTLDFSSVKREDGTAIELGESSISFATEAAPALYIAEKNIYSGYDVYVADADSIGINGLYTIAAKVKNSVSEAKSATAIVAAYNANGKLIETAYVSKSIAAGATETLAAGMTIPADLAGGTVKVFLWNGVGSMQPYIKPITEAIASAN